jgi:hypothetical protein
MKYAFTQLELQADSFYDLIGTWAEMQLVVPDEGAAYLHGYGFTADIAAAFSALVLDWSARIELPADSVQLEPGEYELIRLETGVYACRGGEKWLLGDVGCRVVVKP